MFENNNHNSQSCDCAEQIVSFLYGEIEETDKLNFERHLQKCSSCAGELAEFSLVRASIQDWRAADFENLSVPLFEISETPAGEATVSASWLEKIRAFFGIYGGWMTATALAAVLVFAGFIWFVANSSNKNQIAEERNNGTNEQPISSQITENASESSNLAQTGKKEMTSEEALANSPSSVKRNSVKTVSVPSFKANDRIPNLCQCPAR